MPVTVHKYPIQIGAKTTIVLPRDSKVVLFDVQGTTPTLWIEQPVDRNALDLVARTFTAYGTGWTIDEKDTPVHLGSTIAGPFVWHAYELVPRAT